MKVCFSEMVERTADLPGNVGYDLSFVNSVFQITERIRLSGDDPGALLRAIWENSSETDWNHKAFFADAANRWYEVRLDGSTPSSCRAGSTTPSLFMPATATRSARGATYQNFTRIGTLMSDLTVAGFQDYFWTVEFYGEFYGNMPLNTVLAPDLVTPAIRVYQKMYGATPNPTETNALADFDTNQ